MKIFRNIRKFFASSKHKAQAEPQPLHIDGISDAPVTPEPDDAELAAQALLEIMSKGLDAVQDKQSAAQKAQLPEVKGVEYYSTLADRIRSAHNVARLRTLRFIAFCEQELRKASLPMHGEGSLKLLEKELYKRIDTVEREGGELKSRWQHCLAEVTVRVMNENEDENEDENEKQNEDENVNEN